MANEWVRLIPGDDDNDFIRLYQPADGGYHFTWGAQAQGKVYRHLEADRPYLSNAELLALTTVTKVWREMEEVQALVAQLRAVGFVSRTGSGGQFCPWCYGFYPNHESDCARQAALAPFQESADAT